MSSLSSEFLDLQAALAGEYSVERELGRGGMGVVLLARDVQLERHVAIKVLASSLASDPTARERFLREARTAASLSHPHIVPIHRVGEATGFVYFVMSYVPGQTLGEYLRAHGPMTAVRAARLVREVAWALAYAHGRGVVHRDIKPDNILIEEGTGRALVTDFGIARVGPTTLSNEPGMIIGTAQFMSPEQAMSATVDGRSDLYSLGVVAYTAVSGRLPFDATNVPALLMQHVSAQPPSVAEVAPGTPLAFANAIQRCLEKAPDQRFATGEDLAAALAPAADARPSLPAPLRTWLSDRNPAAVFYAAWSGLVGIPMLYDIGQIINYRRSVFVMDLIQLGVLALAPLAPMIGFHLRRARRLFGAGFTLADLRGALDVADREREEAEALDPESQLAPSDKALRIGTYASISVSAVLTFLADAVHFALERRHIVIGFDLFRTITFVGWVTSVVLLGVLNVKQIPIVPEAVRRFLRSGLRDRLWKSRFGEFLAKRLGAPDVSRSVGAGVFQPTELALGGAANELFEALPSAYREQLRELPSIVRSLERQAQRTRAELEAIEQHASAAESGRTVDERRVEMKARLAHAVAALESIRIDLLRLRAGAVDVTSLTTLLEDARLLGDDLARLTAAQREVADMLSPNRTDDLRAPTPV